MALNVTRSMVRGDTTVWDFTVTRDGVAVDLTDSTYFFTAKDALADDDVEAIIAITAAAETQGEFSFPSGAAAGILRLTIFAVATEDTDDFPDAGRNLFYDVRLRESDDTVTTLEGGILSVVATATKATV